MRIALVTSSLSSTRRTCAVPLTSRFFGLLERDGEEKARAVADRRLDPDPAAVQLDELARDRQAEARAVMRSRGRRIHLRELAEDQVVMLGRNTDAAVADLDEQALDFFIRSVRRAQPDFAARRREFNGVA